MPKLSSFTTSVSQSNKPDTFQSVLIELGQQALKTSSAADLFRTSAEAIVEAMDADCCSLWVVQSDGRTLGRSSHYEKGETKSSEKTITVTLDSTNNLLSHQASLSEGAAPKTPTAMTCLATPVMDSFANGVDMLISGKDRPLGVCSVYTKGTCHFSETELQFLKSVTHIFASVMERQGAERLVQLQRQILEQIALGQALGEIFNNLCLLVEELLPSAYCSVMTVDEMRQSLKAEAGPSLPPDYAAGVDGLLIGQCSGSCGTAAYRGEAVFANDINTDPLWSPFRDFALGHGILACWSIPFLAKDRTVLGTFAISHRFPCKPTAYHRQILNMVAHLAAIAYEAYRSAQMLLQANQRLEDRVDERTRELKVTLEQLQQTQAQLIQAEKMSGLGQMTAGIAHEINNPMGFIEGNLEHLSDYTQSLLKAISLYQAADLDDNPTLQSALRKLDLAYIEQDLPGLLKSMNTGVQRVNDIVKGLRNFSRLDEAEQKAVDIHEGLDNTLMILNHRITDCNDLASVYLDKQYGSIPLFTCYANQLNQVFMNILNNAIDALEDRRQRYCLDPTTDRPEISIKTQIQNDQLQVVIADNGAGIAAESQDHIFEPFFTTKPVGKGTGLGMAISYQIITDTHNGNISIASEQDSGTTVTILLPCVP